MRTEGRIRQIEGHKLTISSILLQATEPQIITASHDSTIRMFDWTAGKTRYILKNHEYPVRALLFHPSLNTFVSGSIDNIKQWKSNSGEFIQDLSGHTREAIINGLATNKDGVLVSAEDDGIMHLWDWNTGRLFQRIKTRFIPHGDGIWSKPDVCSVTFDISGKRLIATKADGTIQMYRKKIVNLIRNEMYS
ncbi:hypothetical protein TKK_0012594 [Trichogramma kaykai]|uniref:WD repeat-containing protein 55 homolog n=1 Tax=Trichogramma kaykai TaxID=54128 RepID=A0ABD2WM97_9HYME